MKTFHRRLKRSLTLTLIFFTGMSLAEEGRENAVETANAQAFGDESTNNLARRLYRQDLLPSAENFGQCLGGYIMPVAPTAPSVKTANANERLITVELDRLTAKRYGEVELQGNVLINNDQRLLQAEKALIDPETQEIRFPEGLLITEPDFIVQGERAEISLQDETLQLDALQWLLPQQNLRGTAAFLTQGNSGQVLLRRAELTRCLPGNQGWSLGVEHLEINENEGYAEAKGALLKIRSIPVAYLPRMRISMDGSPSTGWQMPSVGIGSQDGLELQLPYYWQLGDSLSATLAPKWISRRGVGVDGQVGYVGESQFAALDVSFLPSDDLYNGFFDRDSYAALGGDAVLGPFESADRWLVAIEQRGEIGSLSTVVDFSRSSDRDFFRDLDSYVGFANPNALQQFGEVAYVTDHLDIRLRTVGFQPLDELDSSFYRAIPTLLLDYRSNPVGRGFGWGIKGQVAEFDARSGRSYNLPIALPIIEGRRAHLQPSIEYRRYSPNGYWELSGGYKFTHYDLHLQGNSDVLNPVDANMEVDRGVGFFSVDSGLFFERDLKWADREWINTLEPRLFYLYQEYEYQDALPLFDSAPSSLSIDALFADNRYIGLDRIGDADHVTLGVTSRLIENSGRELSTLTLAYLKHLSKPRVQLFGQGDIGAGDLIAAEQIIEISPRIQLRGWQLWHEDRSELEEARGSIHLRGSGQRLYNFGYNQRSLLNIKQAEFSTFAPLTQHLAVTGRWHYDLASQRTLEAFLGLEYDDCCIKLRLVARQYLENPLFRDFGIPQGLFPVSEFRTDRGLLLEVELKGLAGIGSKVEALLRRSIDGYGEPLDLR